MRTNIAIDNQLMRQALRTRPRTTKKAVVEEGLRLLAQLSRRGKIRALRGALKWEATSPRCAMTLADTSVWIDYFNGARNWQTDQLDSLFHSEVAAMGI